MDIAGSHALVTGGSRGIGRTIAGALHQAGARVSLVARKQDTVSDAARDLGGVGLGADLSTASGADGLIAAVEAEAGPVDILVNNAGIETHEHLARLSADEVDAVLRTNLGTPIELTRQALPGMLERGRGHIVNVSSMSGAAGFPGLTTYAASKAGLSHFSRTLIMDLRGEPVGVTAVEIGTVPSDMLAAIDDPDAYGPTRRSFERAYTLRLMSRVSQQSVADAVVKAVAKDKEKVWLPRRAALFPLLAEIPQRMTRVMLTGVPRDSGRA